MIRSLNVIAIVAVVLPLRDGTLTLIHQNTPDNHAVVEDVQTSMGSRNMGLDPVNHRIYPAAAKFGPRPDSSATNPRRRPPMIPGSFAVIVVERAK